MSNRHDSDVAVRLSLLERKHPTPDETIEFVEHEGPGIIDDSFYWHLLLAAWVHNGTPDTQDRYRVLMQSKRRNRIRAMKRMSLAIWRALPDPVIAYHGIEKDHPDENVDRALAWTLDRAIAEQFAGPGGLIEMRAFPKSIVPFYTDRRSEREVIVLDASQGVDIDTVPKGYHLPSLVTSVGRAHVRRETLRTVKTCPVH